MNVNKEINPSGPENTPRRTYPPSVWEELRAAYLAGGELRPLARAAGIPEGTVLARASREKWHKALQKAQESLEALNREPVDTGASIALERAQRAENHRARMEKITEDVGGLVEEMPAEKIFGKIRNLDTFDKVARRTLGMEEKGAEPLVNINLLGQPAEYAERVVVDPPDLEEP